MRWRTPRWSPPFVDQALVESLARPLGRALAGLHLGIGVERFVVTGGFARALGPAYLALLVRAADAAAWEPGGERAWRFELGHEGDEDGLIGAGRLATRDPGGAR